MTKTTDGSSSSGASGASSSSSPKLTQVQREKKSFAECLCRQYSNWKKNNPKTIVNWTKPESVECSSITNDYNTYSTDSNYTKIDYDKYKEDVKKDCEKLCVVFGEAITKGHTASEYTVNDCNDILPNSINVPDLNALSGLLRKEHNLLNKLAQRNVSIKRTPGPSEDLLVNLDNNLKKNVNINSEELKKKARSINTKKRMLLYDEETDRLYRMIIFILKFLLLVISIVTIKLIYDY